MRLLGDSARSQREVVALDQAIVDRALRRSFVHRMLGAGLIGLVYGIFAGVILAAYHEFGSRSLIDRSPLVAADPRPLKLVPQQPIRDEAVVAGAPVGQQSAAGRLADALPVPATGETQPAMMRPDAGLAGEMALSFAVEEPDAARDGAEPDAIADDVVPEQLSLAAEPEMPPEAVDAALPEATPLQPTPAPAAVALPPTPAFKPLGAIPTVMAEAALPAMSSRDVSRSRPPRPTLKPLLDPSQARPEPREPARRAVAASAQSLPEALRAFWTNLKILLASAPASSNLHAGRDGGDGNGGVATASGSGSSSPGGGTGVGGGSNGGGGGSTSGDGGSGTSGSGTSGSGASASSGGGGNSASSGGDGGRGRGDSAGGDRGGRGDGDRGDGGGGRGGDDDDD